MCPNCGYKPSNEGHDLVLQIASVPSEGLPSPDLGERSGCVKQGELGGWTGKEGEWWRDKDSALPTGHGKGSGWGGERRQCPPASHIHTLLAKQEWVSKGAGDKEGP